MIQMKNGNGMLIACHNLKGRMKRISILKNNISMRNYREFLFKKRRRDIRDQ